MKPNFNTSIFAFPDPIFQPGDRRDFEKLGAYEDGALPAHIGPARPPHGGGIQGRTSISAKKRSRPLHAVSHGQIHHDARPGQRCVRQSAPTRSPRRVRRLGGVRPVQRKGKQKNKYRFS